ncbi:glycerophosphodiester phosphodiesterase family protein, partial [Streptomyces sp. NPDC000851]
MSARHFLAGLALVPVLALPTAAHATTTDGAGVLPQKSHFDLQAHRGGLGMTTESTLEGFGKALRLGVTTLELDTQVTKDRKVVVTHDRQVSAQKCRDTAPVVPGDPMYPYVGKYIKDLTLAQIRTMDCGYQQLPGHPEQEQIKGARMVELRDVLDLVKSYQARQVTLNIETKVEAGAPEQTAPRELFVRRVFEEIRASGLERQVTIQSFDWGALKEMHRLAPRWPLVALTNYDFLQVGRPGLRESSHGAAGPFVVVSAGT